MEKQKILHDIVEKAQGSKNRSVERSDSTCLSPGFSTAAQSTNLPIPGSHKEEGNDQGSQVKKKLFFSEFSECKKRQPGLGPS